MDRRILGVIPVIAALLLFNNTFLCGQPLAEPKPAYNWLSNCLLNDNKDTATLLFIGDVMQHGYQIRSALIKGKEPNSSASYDYSHTFKYIKEQLAAADLAVANMEFPVGVPPYRGYPLFSAPFAIAEEAFESGIGLFLVANNHLLDMGERGIARTLELYDSLGVAHTGAYRDRAEEVANNPKILTLNGIKIAFINFTYGTNGHQTPEPYIINLMDSVAVKRAIARGFERGAEIIIALPHWGEEYIVYPSKSQKEWARMLRQQGVRVIIGTHPHVPQTYEINHYKGFLPLCNPIKDITFYSLGNYISNQSNPDYTQLGLMVTIGIVKDRESGEIELLPPKCEPLWCFKKGEFEKDYTTVPLRYFKDNLHERGRVKESEYTRMIKTYNYIDSIVRFNNLYYERKKD